MNRPKQTQIQLQVILVLGSFYNYAPSLHTLTHTRITDTFGTKLCPRVDNMNTLTLDYARDQTGGGCQIILIYGDEIVPIPNNFYHGRVFCKRLQLKKYSASQPNHGAVGEHGQHNDVDGGSRQRT